MGAPQKLDLEHRLEAYFATVRGSSLGSSLGSSTRDALKRTAGNWQKYAAVTGSAMAMATSASVSVIGSGLRDVATDPSASVLLAQHLASANNIPLMNALRLAGVRQPTPKASQQSQLQAPTISAGGVVPIFSTVNIIQPGEWVSIYGTNLASETATWNGDFPTSLGGTSVEIDGKPAYLAFVSPGQINLQAPDEMATGSVPVVVTTAAGSATSSVTLRPFAPSFCLLNGEHVCGIILRSDGSGAYGGGTYDLLGPTGSSFGYPTVAAKAGDSVALFGVGFGPTTPTVAAGQSFSGAAPINTPFHLYINNVAITPTFVGLSSAGLYQINLSIPVSLGQGDVPIQAVAGGMQTQLGAVFSLQGSSVLTTSGFGGGTGAGGSFGGGFLGGGTVGGGTGGLGTNGGGTNGGGTGGVPNPTHIKKPYTPRLQFPPK